MLALVALKLADIRRFNGEGRWCMDCGSGLRGLPGISALSTYSNRAIRSMNQQLLRSLAAA